MQTAAKKTAAKNGLQTLVFSLMLALIPAWYLDAADPKFVEESAEETLEGQKAPAFSLKTLDGKTVELSQLKGKVVLLDFWASWCSPCRKSMPHLQETYRKYKDKGLVIVGVNVDKETEKAKKFLNGLQIDYALALDPTAKLMGEYKVMSMPTAFLIDKKGVIQHRIVGFSDEIGKTTAGQLEALLK